MSDLALQPILALIGYPVAGNPTQYMMEKAFACHQLDCRFLTLEVAPDSLADAVRGMRAMGFVGGTCCDPHKAAVVAHLDRIGDRAGLVGAVNCIVREEGALVGHNNEGQGVLQALRPRIDPTGKRAVILGAGHIARAIAVELAMAKAAELIVVNRTVARATELANMLTTKFQVPAVAVPWEGEYAIPDGVDLVIQATPIGQEDAEAQVPLAPASLKPHVIVADVILNPPRTRLLREADECGCPTVDGLEIFLQQAALSLQQWTGLEANTTVMREAVEEFLLL